MAAVARCPQCQRAIEGDDGLPAFGCDCEDDGGCDVWWCHQCAGFPTEQQMEYFWFAGGKWYCPRHRAAGRAAAPPADAVDRENAAFRKRWTVAAAETDLDRDARRISRLGWGRFLHASGLGVAPGTLSPGMPYLDEVGVFFLPVPGITHTLRPQQTAVWRTRLDAMMAEPLAPDRAVRRKSDGRIGRSVGRLGAAAPIVERLDGKPSMVGRHWGVELHDALWMGMTWQKGRDVCYIPPAVGETTTVRNRRYTAMDRLLATTDPATADDGSFTQPRVWSGLDVLVVADADLADWELLEDAEALEAYEQSVFGF